MEREQKILRFAVSAGEVLLKNGGEIFRVQETISRILTAFGLNDHSLYILSNGIFATLNEGTEHACFALRNVPAQRVNLGIITAVNELSRKIAANADYEKLEQYETELETCANLPFTPLWLRLVASFIGCGCFCFLFGGKPLDCAAAACCGIVLQVFLSFYGKGYISRYMPTIIGSFIITVLGSIMVSFCNSLSLDHIIIGTIMMLVPGVAFTNSIREFFNGDFLSGSIHLIDALLTGICIAVGVGASLWLWHVLFAPGRF